MIQTLKCVVTHVLIDLIGSTMIVWALGMLDRPVHEQQAVIESAHDPMMIFVIVAVAPILEEVVYRRIVFRSIWKQYGPMLAFLISAALFAAVHNNPSGFLVYFWAGLVFARAYSLGGLRCSIAVHALVNAFIILRM